MTVCIGLSSLFVCSNPFTGSTSAAQLQREGRSERGDLLQPLSLPRPVVVPVRGEEKVLDIHGETVCLRGAANEGGDHLSVGSEGGDSARILRGVLRGGATPHCLVFNHLILTRHLYHHTPLEYILKHLYMYPRTLVFGSWDIIQTYHRPSACICMQLYPYAYPLKTHSMDSIHLHA